MLKGLIFLLGILLTFIFILGPIQAMDTKKAKIITQTQALGQVVIAVVLEYSSPIDPSQLSTSLFKVLANRIGERGGELEPRTITKVYTNDKPYLASRPTPGKYVIIELNANDPNASTFFYDNRGFCIEYELEYTIIQKTNIKSLDGKILPPGAKITKERINLIVDDFQNSVYKNSEGRELSYSLFVPKNYDPNESYPLVVFLHGAGERGYNNQTPLKANEGAVVWAGEFVQKRNPCFVLAPQCPQNSAWTDLWGGNPFKPTPYLEMVHELILELQKKYNIDKNRIYLTGLSMGGFGTWALAISHPDTFAALVPICGGGDPSKANLIAHIPTWVFHAEDDPLVNAKFVRDIVKALQDLNAPIKYTEYEKGILTPPVAPTPHASWILAYKNQRMIEWLFSQSKKK